VFSNAPQGHRPQEGRARFPAAIGARYLDGQAQKLCGEELPERRFGFAQTYSAMNNPGFTQKC